MNKISRFDPQEPTVRTMTHQLHRARCTPEHALVKTEAQCSACRQVFKLGESFTLVAVGPGEHRDAQRQARSGAAYQAVAVPVHWVCAVGEVVP